MLSNPHNLVTVPKNTEKRYGIRVSLAGNDPFRRLLADDWETFHWFNDTEERDQTLAEMSRRHKFSRMGDAPSVCFAPIDR